MTHKAATKSNSNANCCKLKTEQLHQPQQEQQQQPGRQKQHTKRPSTNNKSSSTTFPHTTMYSVLSLVLVLLALLTAVSESTAADWMQSCSVCHCQWNSGKKTADCKGKKLELVPRNLSSDMQVVDLSNNQMPVLRQNEFIEASLTNLHKIYLRNCSIHELHGDALKGLAILIELDLSNNYIRELHPRTFQGLEKLRNFVMNNNEIEIIEDNTFANLLHLARVEVKNNRLKRIEINAFGALPTLLAIFLESNSLTKLRPETFSRIGNLKHLSLTNNPWNCTCELQEFRDYVITKRLYTPPTDCAEPANVRGKLWSEVPSENFACKPRILGAVRSFYEKQSDNITLPCRIEATPRANVTWAYNKRQINSNDPRFKIHNSVEQNRAGQPNLMTSELRIFGVRSADKGVYTCIADNRGGKAEAEFHLLVNGDHYSPLDGMGGSAMGSTTSDTETNILLIICLIVTTLLLLLIVVVLLICWYCRRIKTYQKDTTMLSENGLINSKMDKNHTGSMLEGSVIMEMQKSLLTEVNPVEKPPRRTELENMDGVDEGHEIKKTLLDENPYGIHNRDDETHSIALSDTTTPRSRHTYIDDSYATSLPPDLLAFPARVPPTSPSMQSSHSNIPEQIIYGIRSPQLTSPVYAHMTPHGIYGTTTIAAATPNGFMTLQHPKSRSLALIAAANNRQQLQQHQQQQQQQHNFNNHQLQQLQQQQQSPFMPAPVVYSPAAAVVMKQGYMTIPRKPRVPSWAPSTTTTSTSNGGQQHQQLNEFQSPTSPNPSETGTATTLDITSEPVYDNLGLRTTAGGNSTLNLNRLQGVDASIRYNMRDRPLPATPSLTSVASSTAQLLPQQQPQQSQPQQPQQQQPQPQQSLAASSQAKLYEPVQELLNQQQHTTNSDTEPLYGQARHHSSLTVVPSASTATPNGGASEPKLAKVPPRPPPKPKKKMSVTATRGGQGSTSQLFDDEGEDGTEV